jgi:hypothetical protein
MNNKKNEKSVMDKLQDNFTKSIEKKYKKLGRKSKGQGMFSIVKETGRNIKENLSDTVGRAFESVSFGHSGGGTRKNKINKKGKSIKNHLKQITQHNKKRKFINNKPLNIKITIKNN